MNKHLITAGLLILAVSFACKKKEEATPQANTQISTGDSIVFYTNSDSCGVITIKLNDAQVGTISKKTNTPDCASTDASILKVNVATGSHTYTASNDCGTQYSGTINVNKGDCKVKLLSK